MADEFDLKFGIVIFDDDQEPGAGWAATAYADPRKIVARRVAGHNELPTDTIWWSNISYQHFFRGRSEPWRNPNLRHDKYLVLGPADVLREWGYDPAAVGPDFVCTFCAQIFDRIMKIAWRLLSDADPKARIASAFLGKTLREDLRALIPELEYPKLEAAEVLKSGQAWEEFTATGVRGPKGGKWVMLRRPRLSYAMEMLNTPVPRGPYEFFSRSELRQKTKDRVAFVADSLAPCMVEVGVQTIQQEIAPIYGFGAAVDKDKRVVRSWVAHPEFEILRKIAEIDVRSVYQAKEYWGMVPDFNETLKSFLTDKYTEFSWSAGIVAECLWRSVTLGEDKGKSGPLRDGETRAQTSWQGLWIRSADKAQMFKSSMRLAELGYSVLSYGLGWVRCQVGEEEIANLIKDGLTMGLIPLLFDIPDKIFGDGSAIHWGGDVKATALARFTIGKQSQMLWKLDKTPTMPTQAERNAYLRHLRESSQRAAAG